MAQQKNKYLIYVLIITHLLLIQVYPLCHVHYSLHDNIHDLIHNIHSVPHEQPDHEDDYDHQHDHDVLHINVDEYCLSKNNSSSIAKQPQQQYFAISADNAYNLESIFQITILIPRQTAPADWHSTPFQERSPPFHV